MTEAEEGDSADVMSSKGRGEGHGAVMVAALPDGSTSVSAMGVELMAGAVVLVDGEPMTIDEPRGDGLNKIGLTGVVGGKCCVMASWSKHLTSSAVDRSSGV